MKKTTTEIGRLGEAIAAKYLKKNGYRILEQNLHRSHNEIDIIAKNKEYLVFVEVKTRSCEENLYLPYGTPASAVDRQKQKRICTAAKSYLASNKRQNKSLRLDVIEVYLDKHTQKVLKINHITDAFGE